MSCVTIDARASQRCREQLGNQRHGLRLMLVATGDQRQTRNKNATRGDPEEAADRACDEADRGYGNYIVNAAVNHGERGA